MKVKKIIQTDFSVKVYGDNFKYFVKKCTSITAGQSILMIDMPDVNGNTMELDVFSLADGSFE